MPRKSTVYRVRREWCPWPSHELDPESQNQVRLTTSNQDLRIFSLFGKHQHCFLCSWSLLEELDPENSTWSWIVVDPTYSVSIAWPDNCIRCHQLAICVGQPHEFPPQIFIIVFLFLSLFIFLWGWTPCFAGSSYSYFLSLISLWQSNNQCVKGSRLSSLVSLHLSFDLLDFWANCW